MDTNVPLAATSGRSEQVTPLCQQTCLRLIRDILNGEIVLIIDDIGEAVAEYRQQMYPDPNPSAPLASQFMMYVFNHQFDEKRVRRAKLVKDAIGAYTTYPDDDELARFDASDKKWVAIHLSFKRDQQQDAPIVNATDSDWLHFEAALKRLNVTVELICRDILNQDDPST